MTDAPPPLTTPNIDNRDLDSFMLNVERLLASELWALSTGEEFKAALGLWCRAWKQIPAGSLPNDQAVLAGFSGAGKRWPKVREMALRGWVLCSDGRLYHRTLCEDALRAFECKVLRRTRTEAATEARRKQRDEQRHGQRDDAESATVTKSQGRDGTRRDAIPTPPSPGYTSRETPPAATAAPDNPPGEGNQETGEQDKPNPLSQRATGGADRDAIALAVRAGDVICLAEAFRANVAGDRRQDWLRDTDGLEIGVVALIFAWKRWRNDRIREPSGFRAARAAFADLSAASKRELAESLLPTYGLLTVPA